MNSLVQSCRILPVASLLALCGCGADPSAHDSTTSNNEATGEVNLALTTVPTGVQCVQIIAMGSNTVSQNFTVSPGSTGVNTLALGALPVGTVNITGQAYNVACASISGQTPTWVADKLTLTVQGGVVLNPTITFRPNNTVTATANFVGNVTQVAVNFNALDVVYSDGTVRGAGDESALGQGMQTAFGSLSILSNVNALALASSSGCALLKTGSVACWGDNSYGQLGSGGTPSASSSPLTISGMTNVVQIAAGYAHTCALKSDGTVWCWGYNGNGQVGNGTTTNALSPVQVGSSATYIAAGYLHTCSIFNGVVFCWGNNASGQLGEGTTTNRLSPYQTSMRAAAQLALGGIFTCALRGDGALYCWGANGNGQLGYGNYTQLSAPSASPVWTGVQQVSATYDSACLLTKNGGYVWCWGDGIYGQTGDGTGQVTNPSPVQIANLGACSSLAAGGSNAYTSCVVGLDSKLYCFGYGANNQFGNGSTNNYYVPTLLGI